MPAQTGQRGAAPVRRQQHEAAVCVNLHVRSYFQDVENELVAQVSMKQEMELAMKLLEKDIHEKQVSTGVALIHVTPFHTGCANVSAK